MDTVSKRQNTIITNITHIGDPYILADKNTKKYYMYATSSTEGFKVWESLDLLSWKDKGLCFNKNSANTFGFASFWAPEVVYNKKTKLYVMHYTARNAPLKNLNVKNSENVYNFSEAYNMGVLKTGVATSKSPLGPFVDCTGKPMFDLGDFIATIDASLFVDDNGQGYLYYSKDCSFNVVNGVRTSQTWVVKVDGSWTKVIGKHCLVTTPTLEWELLSGKNGGPLWNEGPYVIKHNNKYYLTFSCNCYSTNDYAVGVAVSAKPMQDFIKGKENPILIRVDDVIAGPGHCMFFKDFNNNLWCCYHIQTDVKNPSGNRKMAISRAYFKDEVLVIDYK